jgi:hypothetical protein
LVSDGSKTFGRDDFATVVKAAMRAQIMRPLELAAILAFVERFDLQRIVRATVATAMG